MRKKLSKPWPETKLLSLESLLPARWLGKFGLPFT